MLRPLNDFPTGLDRWIRAEAAPADGTMTASIEATAVIVAAPTDGDGPKLPRFDMVANTGTPMRVGYWRHPVVIDLAGLKVPTQNRPIRLNHDPEQGVGHTDSVKVEAGVLKASGLISRDTPAAREVAASGKNGFPWQASVGTSVEEYEFVQEDQDAVVNGKTFKGPIYVARKTTLGEISFVDLGADGSTSASVAAKNGTTLPAAPPIAANATSGTGDPDNAAAVIARARAERQRQDAIRALVEEAASHRGADIAEIERISAKADEEHWTAQQTELALLRATRPRPVQAGERNRPSQQVLEAALMIAAGVSDEALSKDRNYGPQVVEAAWGMRRHGLRGILAEAVRANGGHPSQGKAFYDDLRAAVAVPAIRAGGVSTVSIPGLLGNTANKVLLTAFENAPSTYQLLADQTDFGDFHTHTVYRLAVTGEWQKVAPGGEIKHGTLEETSNTNKLDTYGMMLSLDRRHIINDELGAFVSILKQLARNGRLSLEKAFYLTLMEASDSFYSVAKGNKVTTNPLGISGLGASDGALAQRTDENGNPLDTAGKFLVVPTPLKSLALSLFNSDKVNETTTTGKSVPNNNPYEGVYQVVASSFLSATALAAYGSSPTTWYMLADPDLLPAFQVAFLDGKRAPTVEQSDTEFNRLGVDMRAYWDYGVGKVDDRGAVKNTA